MILVNKIRKRRGTHQAAEVHCKSTFYRMWILMLRCDSVTECVPLSSIPNTENDGNFIIKATSSGTGENTQSKMAQRERRGNQKVICLLHETWLPFIVWIYERKDLTRLFLTPVAQPLGTEFPLTMKSCLNMWSIFVQSLDNWRFRTVVAERVTAGGLTIQSGKLLKALLKFQC